MLLRAQLFIVLLFPMIIIGQSPYFQNNIKTNGKHYQDLNTVQLRDGSQDFIIGGTVFNSDFTNSKLFFSRVSEIDGSVIWQEEYNTIGQTRGFDITRYQENNQEFIAVTGYVQDANNQVYIGKFNADTGVLVNSTIYNIGSYSNSQGFKIIYTEQFYNGTSTPGFVVVGYSNNQYEPELSNNSNGFVLRTDINLNSLWIYESNSNTSSLRDYDAMNSITETNDGFFITGSVNEPNGFQQGVLLLKIDGQGNQVWSNSYLEGNNRDVGVDAYFELTTNTIYLLVNYSEYHYFGLTNINNVTGVIDYSKSWYWVNPNELNRSGFKISKSLQTGFPDDLIIQGYERDKLIYDLSGNQVNANTVPFSISFNKNTGSLNRLISHTVPYANPVNYNDYFKFWNDQMPLYYYPDISDKEPGSPYSFLVGYRTYNQQTTAIEMLLLSKELYNYCESDNFTLNKYALNTTALPLNYFSSIVNNSNSLTFIHQNTGLELYTCEDGGILAIKQNNLDNINIFPNPTSEYINISGNQLESYSYRVMDVDGRIIISAKLQTSKIIDVSKLSNGLYFIIITSEGKSITKKLIKN